jgi:hypothetical protein
MQQNGAETSVERHCFRGTRSLFSVLDDVTGALHLLLLLRINLNCKSFILVGEPDKVNTKNGNFAIYGNYRACEVPKFTLSFFKIN